MDKAQMLRQQREQRASWFELDDPARRALRIRRPKQFEMVRWKDAYQGTDLLRAAPVLLDLACGLVDDWRGFTEADLLGAAIGSSDLQEFDPENFRLWIEARDDLDLYLRIAKAAFEGFQAHENKKAAAEKN